MILLNKDVCVRIIPLKNNNNSGKSIELSQEHFLFDKDLSRPDQLTSSIYFQDHFTAQVYFQKGHNNKHIYFHKANHNFTSLLKKESFDIEPNNSAHARSHSIAQIIKNTNNFVKNEF